MPTSPLPPERVQFTMRTFFAAAAWLAIGYWAHWTFILLQDCRLHDDAVLLWWSFWLWAGLWGVTGILRAHACRIAMLLGFLVVSAELLAVDVIARLMPFSLWTLEDLCSRYDGLQWNLHWGISLGWGLNLSMALIWGIYLGLLVGVGRTVVRLAGPVTRNTRGGSSPCTSSVAAKPCSQRVIMALLMAAAHTIISGTLAVGVWAARDPLPLRATSARLWQIGMPPPPPLEDFSLETRAGRTFAIGTFVQEMPIFLPVEFLKLHLQTVSVLRPTFVRDIFVITLYYNAVGIPLYFAIGWLIGWRLDRRTARRLAEHAKASG